MAELIRAGYVNGRDNKFKILNKNYINNHFPNSNYKDSIISHIHDYCLLDISQIIINNIAIEGKYLMIDSSHIMCNTTYNRLYALTVNGEVINLKTLEKSAITNIIKITVQYNF